MYLDEFLAAYGGIAQTYPTTYSFGMAMMGSDHIQSSVDALESADFTLPGKIRPLDVVLKLLDRQVRVIDACTCAMRSGAFVL